MKTLEMTAEQLGLKIQLGYIEPIKCLSVFKKLVNIVNVKNEREEVIVVILNR